ncbi:MAG: hypothetical protein ACYCYM_13670 [Saccharofermentanales bacterium]
MEDIINTMLMDENGIQSLEELNNYQVIRSEFLSPKLRPKVTFNIDNLIFNSSCVCLFGDVQYIQILINSVENRMVIIPCNEYAKDSLKWYNLKKEKKMPRTIGCKIFGAKLFDMMGWIPENRYKVQAIYQKIDGQEIILFNLNEFEMVVPEIVQKNDGTTMKKMKVYYPEKWRESFGMTYQEHQESYKINLMENYMVNNTRDGTESKYDSSQTEENIPTPSDIITRQYSMKSKPEDEDIIQN